MNAGCSFASYPGVTRTHAVKGDIVDLAIPSSAQALIAGRYLPVGFRLLKRVVALPGDQVCLSDRKYQVNGVTISTIKSIHQPWDSQLRTNSGGQVNGTLVSLLAIVSRANGAATRLQ